MDDRPPLPEKPKSWYASMRKKKRPARKTIEIKDDFRNVLHVSEEDAKGKRTSNSIPKKVSFNSSTNSRASTLDDGFSDEDEYYDDVPEEDAPVYETIQDIRQNVKTSSTWSVMSPTSNVMRKSSSMKPPKPSVQPKPGNFYSPHSPTANTTCMTPPHSGSHSGSNLEAYEIPMNAFANRNHFERNVHRPMNLDLDSAVPAPLACNAHWLPITPSLETHSIAVSPAVESLQQQFTVSTVPESPGVKKQFVVTSVDSNSQLYFDDKETMYDFLQNTQRAPKTTTSLDSTTIEAPSALGQSQECYCRNHQVVDNVIHYQHTLSSPPSYCIPENTNDHSPQQESLPIDQPNMVYGKYGSDTTSPYRNNSPQIHHTTHQESFEYVHHQQAQAQQEGRQMLVHSMTNFPTQNDDAGPGSTPPFHSRQGRRVRFSYQEPSSQYETSNSQRPNPQICNEVTYNYEHVAPNQQNAQCSYQNPMHSQQGLFKQHQPQTGQYPPSQSQTERSTSPTPWNQFKENSPQKQPMRPNQPAPPPPPNKLSPNKFTAYSSGGKTKTAGGSGSTPAPHSVGMPSKPLIHNASQNGNQPVRGGVPLPAATFNTCSPHAQWPTNSTGNNRASCSASNSQTQNVQSRQPTFHSVMDELVYKVEQREKKLQRNTRKYL